MKAHQLISRNRMSELEVNVTGALTEEIVCGTGHWVQPFVREEMVKSISQEYNY
jgi:hypothetical protein